MVSGTRALAANPLTPVAREAGPPWIWLVPARSADAPSGRDLGTLEDSLTSLALYHAPPTIPEFLQLRRGRPLL